MRQNMNTSSRSLFSPSAIGRFMVQWILPVLAVAVVYVILHGSVREVRALRSLIAFDSSPDDSAMGCGHAFGKGKLTPDQKLVLHGDCTRETPLEREKAIWQKWPTNVVYMHNYITHLTSSFQYRGMYGKTNEEFRVNNANELAKLQSLDPNNARLDYLLAGNLLAQAIKEDYSQSVTNADGTVKNGWGMKVIDRAKLDQAMTHFKAGLSKPEFRRYSDVMLSERLAIMGEPTTLLQQISEIGMAASVLCPDLASCRQLCRTSMAYTRLLIDEGRTNEAREFLGACRKYVPQINNDAETLIDVLVVGAIAKIAEEQIPAAYRRLGDELAAQKAGIETAALAQPVKDWKSRRQALSKDPAREKMIQRHSGMLVGLLLPALGEYPNVADLAPSRLVEYVVAERGALGLISICLIVMMFFCIFQALYYRLVNKTIPRSVFLSPSGGVWVRILLWGVLLPLLGYYGVTRWMPWCNRSLSAAIEYPQFIAQAMALFLVIVAVIMTMSNRWIRRGCCDLELPVAPEIPVFWRGWGRILVGVLLLLAVLPESWLTTEDIPGHAWTEYLPIIIAGTLVLFGLSYLVYGIACRHWFRRTYAVYYGALARLLIPVIALVVILLNCIAQPHLYKEERCWIARDTVMRIYPKSGFTAIEARLVQRLKTEMQQAASKFPETRVSP